MSSSYKNQLLVTGGNGLVGNALKTLCPNAIFLNRHDADLLELEQTRNVFSKYKPQKVIHLAAKVAGVKTNAEKNADMFAENISINTNVLRAAQENDVQKLVAVLSNCVFDENSTEMLQEKNLHIGVPYHGHRGYGYAKRMMDVQIHLLKQQYGSNFTSITPSTIFGPNDNWDIQDSHVVGALIHKCYLAKLEGRRFEVWGSGNAVRQFIYSVDVGKALLSVLETYDKPDTLIVAPNPPITIRTLALTIARLLDFKGEIYFNDQQLEGQIKRTLDSTPFLSLYPEFKTTAFEEALKTTLAWFIKNAKINQDKL